MAKEPLYSPSADYEDYSAYEAAKSAGTAPGTNYVYAAQSPTLPMSAYATSSPTVGGTSSLQQSSQSPIMYPQISITYSTGGVGGAHNVEFMKAFNEAQKSLAQAQAAGAVPSAGYSSAGGGIGGGGNYSFDAIMRDYQAALDSANRANEERYKAALETLGTGYGQAGEALVGGGEYLQGAIGQARDDLQTGYGAAEEAVLRGRENVDAATEEAIARLDMSDELRRKSLESNLQNLSTGIDQALIDRGIAQGSEVLPHRTTAWARMLGDLEAQLGIKQAETGMQGAGLQQQSGRDIANVASAGGKELASTGLIGAEKTLQVGRDIAQVARDRALQQAGVMERREDIGPDLGLYAQLLQNAAQGQYASNMYGAGGVGGAAGTGGLNIVSPQSLGYNLGGPGGMSGHDYTWQMGQMWGAPGGASSGGSGKMTNEQKQNWTQRANDIRSYMAQRGKTVGKLTPAEILQYEAMARGGQREYTPGQIKNFSLRADQIRRAAAGGHLDKFDANAKNWGPGRLLTPAEIMHYENKLGIPHRTGTNPDSFGKFRPPAGLRSAPMSFGYVLGKAAALAGPVAGALGGPLAGAAAGLGGLIYGASTANQAGGIIDRARGAIGLPTKEDELFGPDG